MAQNVYDRPDFFENYSRLHRSVAGLDGAPEWPSLRAMLPQLRDRKVLDLGCGYGWFCRWAREQGASEVLGLDLSKRMLARAQAATTVDGVRYAIADLEHLALPETAFDVAYSSLAFHYVGDAARLYCSIHRALVPGGHLVFSTEHPILMAPTKPGWVVGADGRKTWPVDRYFVEGRRTTDWLGAGVVKYHRTIGTTLALLIRAGFSIEAVQEFCPDERQIALAPALADEIERPTFLLIAARRQAG